jgi:hypothetical protein
MDPPAGERQDRDAAWWSADRWCGDALSAGPTDPGRAMVQMYFTCLAEGFTAWSRMAARWADMVQSMAEGWTATARRESARSDDRTTGATDLLTLLAAIPEPRRSQLVALLRLAAGDADREARPSAG